jgi:CheY-like chemotaxis protein
VVVTTPRTAEREPRILVVDDDPNIRELLTQEFIEAGYQVALAANGREALAEVRRHRPDLVVLDVMMPEMNGFDVAAVLRNDPETLDIPIVILSIVEDRERGFRLGVDRYLTKPIDTDLLFKEVGSLIEQQKSHKRVLVVDEDAPTVKTITEVLQTRGYSVSEARGEDLIERAKALQPDIIMLNSVSPNPETVRMLRFEKGLENVLFLVYR